LKRKGKKKVNENMINENEVSQPTGEEMTQKTESLDNAVDCEASSPRGLDDDEGFGEDTPSDDSEAVDYSEEYAEDGTEEDNRDEDALDINEDIRLLKEEFPELWDLSSADELQNKEKYLRFRGLGLTPAEAYMASGGARVKERPRPTSPLSVKRRDEGIPDRQLRMARELFSEMSDTEIQALYRRVTK
jgi:hypothetical protein